MILVAEGMELGLEPIADVETKGENEEGEDLRERLPRRGRSQHPIQLSAFSSVCVDGSERKLWERGAD